MNTDQLDARLWSQTMPTKPGVYIARELNPGPEMTPRTRPFEIFRGYKVTYVNVVGKPDSITLHEFANEYGNDFEFCGPMQPPSVDTEYGYYFRDAPSQKIDVYRVLVLFNVTHPALQHAIKKLLVAGGRGPKDQTQDVHEAIGALQRWQQMHREEIAAPGFAGNVRGPNISPDEVARRVGARDPLADVHAVTPAFVMPETGKSTT